MSDNEKVFMTTSTGFKVEIVPVSHPKLRASGKKIEREFKEAGEPIEPMTYEVDLHGGGTQTFTYEEKDIEVSDDDELKAEWAAHQDALQRLQNAQRERELTTMLRLGTKFELPDDDSWIEEHEYDGLEVPENRIARLEHYLTHEVFFTPGDIREATRLMVGRTMEGLDPDVVESFLDSFQHTVDETGREELERALDSAKE